MFGYEDELKDKIQRLESQLEVASDGLRSAKNLLEMQVEVIYNSVPVSGKLNLCSDFIDEALKKIEELEEKK